MVQERTMGKASHQQASRAELRQGALTNCWGHMLITHGIDNNCSSMNTRMKYNKERDSPLMVISYKVTIQNLW